MTKLFSLIFSFVVFLFLIFYNSKDTTKKESERQIKNKNIKPKLKKVFLIVDTSWLMEIAKKNVNALKNYLAPCPFFPNEMYYVKIHDCVIKELDGLKKNPDKGLYAVRAIKFIQEVQNNLHCVDISSFGLYTPYKEFSQAISSYTDAIVLSLAKKFSEENKYNKDIKVTLLTTDRTMIILAKQYNINVKDIYSNSYEEYNDTFEIDSIEHPDIFLDPVFESIPGNVFHTDDE